METANGNAFTGGLLNRRSFVTGVSSIGSLILLNDGFALIEHKSALGKLARTESHFVRKSHEYILQITVRPGIFSSIRRFRQWTESLNDIAD